MSPGKIKIQVALLNVKTIQNVEKQHGRLAEGNVGRSFLLSYRACSFFLEVDLFQAWTSHFLFSQFGNQNIFHEITFTKWIKFFAHKYLFEEIEGNVSWWGFRKTSALEFLVLFTLEHVTCCVMKFHNFNDNKHSKKTWKIIFRLHEWTVTSLSNKTPQEMSGGKRVKGEKI